MGPMGLHPTLSQLHSTFLPSTEHQHLQAFLGSVTRMHQVQTLGVYLYSLSLTLHFIQASNFFLRPRCRTHVSCGLWQSIFFLHMLNTSFMIKIPFHIWYKITEKGEEYQQEIIQGEYLSKISKNFDWLDQKHPPSALFS